MVCDWSSAGSAPVRVSLSSSGWVSVALAGLGFYLFIVHLLTAKNPFIPRAAFGDMNFNAGLITMFSVGITLR